MWLSKVIALLFGLGLFINALLFIPQIIRLYKSKNSTGVSLITFGGFTFLQLLAIFHGYFQNDYTLMIGYLFSVLTCGTVFILILFYRNPTNIASEETINAEI